MMNGRGNLIDQVYVGTIEWIRWFYFILIDMVFMETWYSQVEECGVDQVICKECFRLGTAFVQIEVLKVPRFIKTLCCSTCSSSSTRSRVNVQFSAIRARSQ